MWWVLEVQETTQKKLLRGLDNASAEGVDGFKNFLQVIDEQDWCKEVQMRLKESKLYFKTTYRNQCKEDDRKCANHCRVFALSNAGDTDFHSQSMFWEQRNRISASGKFLILWREMKHL